MNYQEFVLSVKEHISSRLGCTVKVHLHTTIKNNGKERIGLTIANEQVNIFPTIYLEEFYEQYQNGFSVDSIAENIAKLYDEIKFDHDWDIDSVTDFSSVKSKLICKLINAEKNQALLKSHPHVLFLDFAVIFYILHEAAFPGMATIPVTNELMNFWGVTLDELHQQAMLHSPKLLPATFKPMRTVIEELLGQPCELKSSDSDIMFVLSNCSRAFGASCILYNGILEQIACQLGENYYVLPSSIHEMIIIPESKSPGKETLLEMVTEINETQVAEEEVLVNSVYYYDFRKRELV